jgi:hypothetical protein
MADSKKGSLLQAVSKLKTAKKSSPTSQNDGSKSGNGKSSNKELKGKIKDAVARFADE